MMRCKRCDGPANVTRNLLHGAWVICWCGQRFEPMGALCRLICRLSGDKGVAAPRWSTAPTPGEAVAIALLVAWDG
jgi:hypothetical protein